METVEEKVERTKRRIGNLTNWHFMFLLCVKEGTYNDFPNYGEIPTERIIQDLKEACLVDYEGHNRLALTEPGQVVLQLWIEQTWPDGDTSKCPVCGERL